MTIKRILVVDDEEVLRDFVSEALVRKGFDVEAASNGREALEKHKDNPFQLIITDMKMPKMNGLDLLKAVKEFSPGTLVIVITAHGTVDNAVEAMQAGAFHYLIKPFTADTVDTMVKQANNHLSLCAENHYLRQEVAKERGVTDVVAESPEMKRLMETAKKVAISDTSVMITGESGTGKEVLAHTIYTNSNRKDAPYIRVNCAAIPETLLESEFFGHEKGSFTGAEARRAGRFELADEGTLLLDEVTEIPLHLQPKLLRAIQMQEFERVGGTKPIHVDVRMIATSNCDLKSAVENNSFREDLYYRLNVIPMHIPPLRERKDDILPLAKHFLQTKSQKKAPRLSKEAEERLLNYSWPGNVRELANVIERAQVLEAGATIGVEHLYLEGPMTKKGQAREMPIEEIEEHYAKSLGITVKMLKHLISIK